VSFENLKHTKVTLPNAPNAGTNPQRDPHQQSITDMAFSDGRLYIAGLSNEEFASKLRSVKYPSRPPTTAPPSRLSRQSRPARNALARLRVPAVFDQQRAAPRGRVSVHAAGEVSGGHASARNQGRRHDHRRTRHRNRPIDMVMVLYKKDGREFLLMSNTSRGVMKIPTDGFANAAPITQPVKTETGGIAYETITAMKGVEQLDLLDGSRTLALSRGDAGLNLVAVALP
jgi:hypothetical protein